MALPNFVERTVVITGASAGIGAATARQFADLGANLVLAARGALALDALARELAPRAQVLAVPTDVADVDACHRLLARAVEHFGGLHVLVNNAAANARGPVAECEPDRLAHMVDVNLRAPIALSCAAVPLIQKSGGGAIVNVASLAGRIPLPGEATYSATKFGLRAFSLAMAEELEGSGITVSVVSPGPVETQFLMDNMDHVPDKVFSQPMSSAETIASLIVKCAQDGKPERAWPRASGYLTTLGYLSPRLTRALAPMLERQGRKQKERYRRQSADEHASNPGSANPGNPADRHVSERAEPLPAEGKVVVTSMGARGFAQEIRAGHHRLYSDEPESVPGGTDTGPAPYELLLAGLGACTSMTLRMYADRKQWPLEGVRVTLSHEKRHAKDCEDCNSQGPRLDHIDREIELSGPLSAEQRARLIDIANKCPVHRTLQSQVVITTTERER